MSYAVSYVLSISALRRMSRQHRPARDRRPDGYATPAARNRLSLYHGGMLKHSEPSTPDGSAIPLHPLTDRFSVTPIRLLGGVPYARLMLLLSCKSTCGTPPF